MSEQQPLLDENQMPKNASDAKYSKGNDEIPDGGWKAWLQVLGSFFLMFNSW